MGREEKPYRPVFTDEERVAAKATFATELCELSKQIAFGKHKGHMALIEVIWRIQRKIHAAESLEITKSRGRRFNGEFDTPILSDLEPLVEFVSSPEVRYN